jgi:NADPH-dependent curcumin reductase CurA
MPGQTAYWGILDVGKIKAGENVVVSGAAGAVGTTVCQIAKIKGCKVTGIAGGPEKCKWLEQELGIKAIDYKGPNFVQEFKKIGYLDVFCEWLPLISTGKIY